MLLNMVKEMYFSDLAKQLARDQFQPVAYTTGAITPLVVITNRDKGAIPIGRLQDFMINIRKEMPPVETEPSLNVLEGNTMKDLKANISADPGSLLRNIFKMNADVSRIASLQYRFADIQHSYILPVAITSYLCASDPDPNPATLSYVREEDEAYIVSDVLQSGIFGVMALDQNGNKIDMTASAGDAGFSLTAESKKALEGYSVYNNPAHPHTFAIRAFSFWCGKDKKTGNNAWKFRKIVALSPGLMVKYADVNPDEIIVVNKSKI
jgi:hypothetical protein